MGRPGRLPIGSILGTRQVCGKRRRRYMRAFPVAATKMRSSDLSPAMVAVDERRDALRRPAKGWGKK